MVGALAALAVGAAGAYFAAQVQVPDSMIRAGSVAISTLPTSAPLAIDALAPGTTAVRPMSVVNDGSLASDIIVTAKKSAGITEFYDSLACTVTCGGTPLYAGTLSSLRTLPLRLAPGARGELRFEVGPARRSRKRARRGLREGVALRRRRAGPLVRTALLRLAEVVLHGRGTRGGGTGTAAALEAGARGRRLHAAGASPGDLVIVDVRGRAIRDQIALLRSPRHGLVLHRVIATEADGSVRTRGDANTIPDFDSLPATAVDGAGRAGRAGWEARRAVAGECRVRYHDCSVEQHEAMTETTRSTSADRPGKGPR